MKIVDSKSITTHNGKAELNAVEKWLFDKEGKKVRLTALMNMDDGKAAIAELEEFQNYGSNKKKTHGLDNIMNRVFVLGEIPLVARARTDKVVIRKSDKFELEIYSKADRKEMSANHIETVKSKLAEVLS